MMSDPKHTLEASESSEADRQAQFAKDKQALESYEQDTQQLLKQLENMKNIDKLAKDSGHADRFKNIKYVEREEDPELKAMFEKKTSEIANLGKDLEGKVDGEIHIDLHGNLEVIERQEGGITEPGTYVLRNGKLVPGKGMVREPATFSNWYCSNADPEDLRRHRELMDRMHYRGPKWEGIGVPKSILEEENPVYRKVDPEAHPSTVAPEKEGKKDFEYVVR